MQKKPELIAPCGMNCGICMAFLREKNRCLSCRGPDDGKAVSVLRCKIRTCEFFQKNNRKFCFECDEFPCKNLKHLDKRYRTKYAMSMVENLTDVKDKGVEIFLENQERKYKCPKCGGVISVHRRKCYTCGYIETG